MKSVDIFPWDDNFCTGLETVDKQHRKLVELINRLASRFAFDSETVDLATVFDDLVDYTHYHFETEEGIWETHLSEDGSHDAHRRTHKTFIDNLNKIIELQKERPVVDVAEETLDFLVRWLVSHILESDRRMAYTVQALQAGNDLQTARKIAEEQMSGYTRRMIDIILQIYGTLSHNTLRLMRELSERQKAENLLMSNQRLLQTVIDEMPDILALKDAEGKFRLVNRVLCEFYGATPEEMIGKDDADFGVPEVLATRMRQSIGDVLARGKAEVVMEDSRDANTGELRHFRSVKKPFRDDEHAEQVLVIAHDITDLQRAKEELMHQRGFLQTLVHTIPDLVWLKNPEGVYLACNPKFESFFGAKEAQIVGKTDYEFVDEALADFFREHDRMAMAKGEPSVNEEWITFAEDGHRELLETTKTPMYDEQGTLIGVLGIGHDITRQRQAEERLKFALGGSNDGLWDWNLETDEVYYSPRWLQMLGYEEGELPEHLSTWERLVHPDDKSAVLEVVDEYLEGKTDKFEVEMRMRHKAGHWVPVLSRAKIPEYLGVASEQPRRLVGTHTDVTERWRHQEELRHIAHYDALTGLPNRLLLSDRLRQAIAQADRRGAILAVVYLDLDGFKEVNDLHGHDVGDQLLVAISAAMKRALREEDTLARLGGDEFVAVLQNLEDHDATVPVLERLLEAVARPMHVGRYELRVSASLGVTFYPQAETIEPDQLIRQGDQAMYQAKQAGKNRYHLFDSEHDRSMRSRHERLERIRLALAAGEFVLHYQPKVDMYGGDVIGVEALIRWNHPDKGLLPPAAFLPQIENHPLIVEVGNWVLGEAMDQIERWHAAGLNLCVSVNVDGAQLQQNDFLEHLRFELERHPGVRRGDLELEVLETSALEDIESISEIINESLELGVNFSIDDFGTGYSSLTYLKRLPIHTLKLDRSFVLDMLDDPDDLAILDGILSLGNVFGREAVAEGVETVAHGDMLLKMGCRLGQGYAIARPMSAEKLAHWIEGWQPPEEWLQRSPLNRDDWTLLYAEVELRAWSAHLIRYFKRYETNLPQTDTARCHFGHWIAEEGRRRYESDAAFDRILDAHEELHALIGQLLGAFGRHDQPELERGIETIEAIRNRIVADLHALGG